MRLDRGAMEALPRPDRRAAAGPEARLDRAAPAPDGRPDLVARRGLVLGVALGTAAIVVAGALIPVPVPQRWHALVEALIAAPAWLAAAVAGLTASLTRRVEGASLALAFAVASTLAAAHGASAGAGVATSAAAAAVLLLGILSRRGPRPPSITLAGAAGLLALAGFMTAARASTALPSASPAGGAILLVGAVAALALLIRRDPGRQRSTPAAGLALALVPWSGAALLALLEPALHGGAGAHALRGLAGAALAAVVVAEHVAGARPAAGEDRFRTFAESAADPVLTIDESGRILFVNAAAEEVFGHARDSLLGQPLTMLMPPYLREAHAASLRHFIETGRRHMAWRAVELPGMHATGRLIPLEISLGEIRHDGRRAFYGIARDVSRRKSAERALRESEERYALAVRGANDGIWDWDLKADRIYFSARWKALLGLADHAVGTDPDEWFSRVHDDDLGRLRADIAAHLAGRVEHFQSEHRMRHADGSWRWMLARGLSVSDTRGRPSRMAGSLTDVTDRRQTQERLLHEVLHDALTGLPNRTFFMDRLRQALRRVRRRPGHSFGVLFVDLDRFKVINDSLGHVKGDELLVAFSRRLESCLRPGDSAARLGGDEFAVFLDPMGSAAEGVEVAERIHRALQEGFRLGDQEVFTTASIGIAAHAAEYHDPDDFLRDADTAMYRAKAAGRARHAVFEPGMHVQAVARLQLETELRRALEDGQVELAYQPVASLATGATVGIEALVRWRHPERGLLPPGEFLPVAEDCGLMADLGQRVLDVACRDAAAWRRRLPGASGLFLALNVAPSQVARRELPDELDAALAAAGLRPEDVVVEITEGALLREPAAAREVLGRLAGRGYALSLDDFGIGYASLSHLAELPLAMFKIDRTFVARMGPDGGDSELVRTMVHLGLNLGLQVVAEGVEHEGQLRRLRDLGCHLAQGRHVGEEMSAAGLLEHLADRMGGPGGSGAAPQAEASPAWPGRRD